MDDKETRTREQIAEVEHGALVSLVWRLHEYADVLESLQNRASEGAARATGGALAEYRWGEENAYFVARSWIDAILEVAMDERSA